MTVSFEALFHANARPLLAYALRRVDRPEDAADVVAETMLVAWRRRDEVPEGDEARLWLFGVARRVLANIRRSHARQHRLAQRLREHLATLTTNQSDSAAPDEVVVVRQALARLSGDDRELLRLAAWEELTPAEVAVVLGIKPATARTRLHRARNRLRAELERTDATGHVFVDGRALVRLSEEAT